MTFWPYFHPIVFSTLVGQKNGNETTTLKLCIRFTLLGMGQNQYNQYGQMQHSQSATDVNSIVPEAEQIARAIYAAVSIIQTLSVQGCMGCTINIWNK